MTTQLTDELERENEELRRRLEEAEGALQALRAGEVDAVLVELEREQVYTLESPEMHYRLLVERVPSAAATVTCDGAIIYCNSRFIHLLQRPLQTVLGKVIGGFVAPESRARLADLLRDGVNAEVRADVSLQRPDGTTVPAYLGVSAHREGAFGVCLLITDLTEQRHYEELQRTQAALRASEERYRTLFESIDEGFCVIQVLFDEDDRPNDYRFLEINPSFEAQTGLGDVVGKTMRQMRPGHEEHWFRIYGQIAMTGEPMRFQNRAEALHRWYDVYAFRIGEPWERKVAVLFNDITERKQTEEALYREQRRMQLISDSVPSLISYVDTDTRYRFCNRAYSRWFGLTREAIIGRTMREVLGDEAWKAVGPHVEAALAGNPADFETEARYARGGTRWIHAIYAPDRDADGRVRGLIVMVSDVTANKTVEQTLRDADRRKDEFLATLAHELRNPLAPIRNAVQVLKAKGPPDPELDSARAVLDRQVQHMTRLLEDLLDVSRISRSRLDLRRGRVGLASVVEAALETSRPVIESSGHNLTVTLPPEPIYLEADSVRLAQVFANLLNNAAKYTDEGGEVRLTAERQGSDVVVSVQDSGIGIAAEMLPRVFEIFSQATPALGRSQGGLGIGLSLVKGLVELHGGRVEAKSGGPGQGSEFIVRLPVAAAASASEAPRSKESAPKFATTYRILIVDDNRDSADSLAMLLQIMGNQVGTAYDGEQAIELADSMRPDVVLLDLGMPKLNGYDACRRIRQQPWGQSVCLVALTGWGQEEDRRRTEEAGFNCHMVKPVDTDTLLTLLSSLSTARGSGAIPTR